MDFCCRCYEEMQSLFASCSIENAKWAVRFINAVANYVLKNMPPSARRLLVRQLAFELPLTMFRSLVQVVVDVTDASVVHIEDNIEDVADFADFWHTLGLMELLHAANLLPMTEQRGGQAFQEGARLPGESFVLLGIDKCEVYADWKRWKDMSSDGEEKEEADLGGSDVLNSTPFHVERRFTCFLSHSGFVPRAFLRRSVQIDANAASRSFGYRTLEFRRQSLHEDILANLGYCFEPGHAVRVTGVQSTPSLNGKEGELGPFDQQKGRWKLSLKDSDSDKTYSLRPFNLVHVNEDDVTELLGRIVDPRFAGENGMGPGVHREFYQLALQTLVSNKDFWEYSDEVRTYWFNDSTGPEAICACRAMGAILGNAIRLDVLLPAIFPEPLYALLLCGLGSAAAGQWSLADLRKVNPHFARSFEQLMEYDKDDVASLFTLEWPRSNELEDLPREARGSYVQAYVDWFFDVRFEPKVRALVQGFRGVLQRCQVLQKLVSVEQFGQILSGVEEPVDVAAIRRKATEVGWSSSRGDQQYLEHFWATLASFDEQQRRKFVVFASSSARAPLKGWSDFGLQVQKNGDGDKRLPTAYTCFHLLLLPVYSSKELLRPRLLHAIEETQGFGLY